MLIPDTQDSMQNGFHIPRTDLKCEAKKQRKNEQISNFDFQIMLKIRIISLKSYGGYYRVSKTNLLNNFPCVFEDEFQWSWQLGSWRLQFFQIYIKQYQNHQVLVDCWRKTCYLGSKELTLFKMNQIKRNLVLEKMNQIMGIVQLNQVLNE
ncbi:Hypothetical_protein [Hexamita inflata]|uniref:Hypothetical_protein n=1 Tax=Hexamita inflata TaxID=28002 RepID=A0AA86NJ46_9EUKA|nr:Hypothetical protein HINF_LOCUS7639 [Hexamita inflata]